MFTGRQWYVWSTYTVKFSYCHVLHDIVLYHIAWCGWHCIAWYPTIPCHTHAMQSHDICQLFGNFQHQHPSIPKNTKIKNKKIDGGGQVREGMPYHSFPKYRHCLNYVEPPPPNPGILSDLTHRIFLTKVRKSCLRVKMLNRCG